jgi:hypothetical protein
MNTNIPKEFREIKFGNITLCEELVARDSGIEGSLTSLTAEVKRKIRHNRGADGKGGSDA